MTTPLSASLPSLAALRLDETPFAHTLVTGRATSDLVVPVDGGFAGELAKGLAVVGEGLGKVGLIGAKLLGRGLLATAKVGARVGLRVAKAGGKGFVLVGKAGIRVLKRGAKRKLHGLKLKTKRHGRPKRIKGHRHKHKHKHKHKKKHKKKHKEDEQDSSDDSQNNDSSSSSSSSDDDDDDDDDDSEEVTRTQVILVHSDDEDSDEDDSGRSAHHRAHSRARHIGISPSPHVNKTARHDRPVGEFAIHDTPLQGGVHLAIHRTDWSPLYHTPSGTPVGALSIYHDETTAENAIIYSESHHVLDNEELGRALGAPVVRAFQHAEVAHSIPDERDDVAAAVHWAIINRLGVV